MEEKRLETEDLVPNEVAPGGMDRRRFVKGCIAVAGIGSLTAAGAGVLSSTTNAPPSSFVTVPYLGAARSQKSPAPRGLPLVPLRFRDDDVLEAVPEHLDWLRYCGQERFAPLGPRFTQDNALRFAIPEERIAEAEHRGWDTEELFAFRHLDGDLVRREHIAGMANRSGFTASWRSEAAPPGEGIGIIVVKVDPRKMDPAVVAPFLEPTLGLLGFSGTCTHVCCAPGVNDNPSARTVDAWDHIYCGCHGSRFDPEDIQPYTFQMRVAQD